MAKLGKVCSHVEAILFYVKAMRHTKSCTDIPCPWNIPSHIDTIPYATITDIDFSAPKPVPSQPKRGAHLKIDSPLNSGTVEGPYSSHHSAMTSLFNVNKFYQLRVKNYRF